MKKSTSLSASKSLILAHQLPAFQKLLNLTTATFHFNWKPLRVRPRTSTLLIGPSGTGKSFLARAVAEECGAAFLHLTAGDWILMGASGRGTLITWPMICRFLMAHHKAEAIIIFLDEIDKVTGQGSWDTHLRTEIFNLLDKRIPPGITDEDGDPLDRDTCEQISEALSYKTLILGAGAWQPLWEIRERPKMGFSDQKAEPECIGLNHLAATLPRELTNRFRSDLVMLPQLAEDDYLRMLEHTSEEIPPNFKNTFFRLGNARIADAVRYRLGCRFVEELLLDVVMAEREVVRTNTDPSAVQKTYGESESNKQPEICDL